MRKKLYRGCRERGRKTDRQTGRQTDRLADRLADTHETELERGREGQRKKQTRGL